MPASVSLFIVFTRKLRAARGPVRASVQNCLVCTSVPQSLPGLTSLYDVLLLSFFGFLLSIALLHISHKPLMELGQVFKRKRNDYSTVSVSNVHSMLETHTIY